MFAGAAWKRATPLILTALLAASCAGSDARPDRPLNIAQRPVDAGLAALLAPIPADIYPAVLTVWPDRTTAAGPALTDFMRALAPQLPDGVGPFEALGMILAPTVTKDLPPLQGLDRTRPIIMALYGVPEPELFDAVTSGNIPDPLEAPQFLHNRFIVPATDIEALKTSLIAWGNRINLQPSRHDGAIRAVKPGATTLATPGLTLVMIPGDGFIQLDVALTPVEVKQPTEPALAELLTRTSGSPTWSADTPARVHFLEGHGAISVHLDFDRFPGAYVAFSTLEVAQALEQLPPDTILKVLASGSFNTLTAAQLMHPRNRGVTDMTMSLIQSPGQALDIRMTQTLTAAEQIAYEAATRTRSRATVAATSPVASIHVRRSWRELVRALPEPTCSSFWDSQELTDRVYIGGATPFLYLMFANPWRGLDLLIADMQADNPTLPIQELPHNAVLVLEEFSLDPDNPALVAGLMLDLPPGTSSAPYKQMGEFMEEYLKAIGLRSPIQVQALADKQSTRVMIGIGKTPDKLFVTPEGGPSPIDDFALTINGAVLGKLLTNVNPQLASYFENFGTLSLTDRREGRCLATHVRLSLLAPAEPVPEPVLVGGPSAVEAPPALTKSQRCLIDIPTAFEEVFRASTSQPEPINVYFNTAAPTLETLFACARGDAEQVDEVRLAEGGWYMTVSRLNAWAGDRENSVMWAKKACELGRQAGCTLAAEEPAPPQQPEP